MMNMKNLRIVFLILASLFVLQVFPQVEDTRIKKLNTQINKLNHEYPQQRIFVQFDHPYYTTSDKIFLKAFVLNYSSYLPDTVSTNLYIEMIDSKEMLNYISILRLENGIALAEIDLKDTIQAGVYRFRAYTNWSRNFGDEFFFSKYLLIAPSGISSAGIEDFKNHLPGKSEKLQVQFFSEGGNFVSGLENHIIIKTNIEQLDNTLNASIIYKEGDNSTNIVFNKNGISSFWFVPDKEKEYFVSFEFDGKLHKYELPEFKDRGYILKVNQNVSRHLIEIELISNVEKTLDDYANSVFFLLQSGGEKQFFEKHILKEKKARSEISSLDFPSGVMLITAFDNDLNKIAERLIFHPPGKRKKPGITIQQNNPEDSAIIVINTNAQSNKGLLTLYTNEYKSEISNLFNQDLRSYLWFNSFLPSFEIGTEYLDNISDQNVLEEIDKLLICEEWIRYDWNNIVNDQFPEIEFQREKNLVVSGWVTRQMIKIPLENSLVKLTVLNEFYFNRQDTTDEHGRFYFDRIDLFDTVKIKLEAKREYDKKDNVLIMIDEADLPGRKFDKSIALYKWYKNSFKAEKKKNKQKYYREQISADTVKSEDRHYRLYSQADHVINANEMNMQSYTSIADVIKSRVPGVDVYGTGTTAQYVIRGKSTLMASTEPLFLIDGMEVDRFAFNNIPPADIDKIEVLKGAQAAIYGIRGGNGVLALYTKGGVHVISGKLIFDMLGYQNIQDIDRDFKGKLLGNPAQNWYPVLNYNETDKTHFFKVDNILNKEIIIEGIFQGIPISEKLNVQD